MATAAVVVVPAGMGAREWRTTRRYVGALERAQEQGLVARGERRVGERDAAVALVLEAERAVMEPGVVALGRMTTAEMRSEAARAIAAGAACLADATREAERIARLDTARMSDEWRRAGEAGDRLAATTTEHDRRAARRPGGSLDEWQRARRLERVVAESRITATPEERGQGALCMDAAEDAPLVLADQAPLWAQEPGATVVGRVTLFYAGDGRRVAWAAVMESGKAVFGDAWGERALVGWGAVQTAMRSMGGADAVARSVTWKRADDARVAGGAWYVYEAMHHGARHDARVVARRKMVAERESALARPRAGRVLGACRVDAHEACPAEIVQAGVEITCTCACHGAAI